MAAPQDRQTFPVRLPLDLHRALKEQAEATPDITMNDLVVLGVRNVIQGDDLTLVTESDMTDARTDLVIAAIEGEIGALKGTAQHFVNLGRANLAGLLYWMSAEAIGKSDPKAAAKELLRTADQTPRHLRPLAIALLRSALRWNPANEVAKNRLGQLLYFEGDFEGALEYLAPITDRDNRARLFHGWAALRIATDEEDRAAIVRSRDEIADALEAWAFGERDPRQRSRWLRQLAQLHAEGPDFNQTVHELVAYANDNTSWTPITDADLAATLEDPRDPDLEE